MTSHQSRVVFFVTKLDNGEGGVQNRSKLHDDI